MNEEVKTYIKLENEDFLNSDIDVVVCSDCKYVSLFGEEPKHRKNCININYEAMKMFGFVYAFLKSSILVYNL